MNFRPSLVKIIHFSPKFSIQSLMKVVWTVIDEVIVVRVALVNSKSLPVITAMKRLKVLVFRICQRMLLATNCNSTADGNR